MIRDWIRLIEALSSTDPRIAALAVLALVVLAVMTIVGR